MGMRACAVAAAVVAVALSGCIPLPLAKGWQLGAGVSQTRLHTDYSALDDPSTPGIDLVGSWGFARHWWLDAYTSLGTGRIKTGTTDNIYYPPDTARYSMFVFDVRREWPVNGSRGLPWLSGGIGLGDVSWDTYWYGVTGIGPVLGAGFDLPFGRLPLALRAQLQWYRFSGEDTYGYGTYHLGGVTGSATIVWTFGAESEPAEDVK